MKLAIMQPYFFPYIGYFQLIHAADKFVFYDDVNYIKNGWINRNRLVLGGRARYFTVPLSGASPFSVIRETRINVKDTRWKRKMLATFECAYARAPCVTEGMQLVGSVLSFETDSIAELAKRSISAVMEYLGLQRETVATSEIYANSYLRGAERVLDICQKERAATYINAPGGRALYDEREFSRAGVALRFVETKMRPYRQDSPEFIPNLSIVDVIMRCPPAMVNAILLGYELVPPSLLGVSGR